MNKKREKKDKENKSPSDDEKGHPTNQREDFTIGGRPRKGAIGVVVVSHRVIGIAIPFLAG